jgi:hypothetical protein
MKVLLVFKHVVRAERSASGWELELDLPDTVPYPVAGRVLVNNRERRIFIGKRAGVMTRDEDDHVETDEA